MFILASASPRRLQLLQQISVRPDKVIPADIDESARDQEKPRDYAKRMCQEKALLVHRLHPEATILAADTVVACGNHILPKAEKESIALKCLLQLSNRKHDVWGGLCLILPDGTVRTRVVRSKVKFCKLSPEEIQKYLISKEWDGKAGGYAIQGYAAAFVESIQGCYFNIMGLSVAVVYKWLKASPAV